MRRENMKKYLAGFTLLLVLSLIPYLAVNIEAKTVTFKIVTMQPKGKPISKNLMMFADALKSEFDGQVIINFLGGPEVIGPFQQHEAVRSGQIDMALTSASFYSSLTPLSHVNMFSNLRRTELLKIGFYDIHEEIHRKIGLGYLGEITFDVPFFIFTNFEVKSLKDFVGKKIRVFPAITPFMKALGAAPVMMGQHEIYSAMDRGVVDGFVMSTGGFVKGHSWHEVTKYMIKPSFYRGGLALLINPKSWDKVPKDLQKKIKDWKYNVWDPDPNGGEWFVNFTNDETKMVEQSGVKVIELSPADAKVYLKKAYDSAWQSIIAKKPVEGLKLKKMLFNEALLPR